MDIQFDIIIDYLPLFLKGTLLTLGLALAGVLIGLVFGLLIGLGKMSTNAFIRFPFVWYVNIFRGTPFLVQILLIHFGVVPLFMTPANPIVSAIIALSLNSAAYIAEIFRAGIQSIDKGQMEAARSLGMSHTQAMKLVILPQAVKRMIPPLGNEFIVLLKETSLAAIIAAPELMYWGRAAGGQYLRVWEPYITVALIYLVLTLSLTYLMDYIERRMKTA
ncbi:amino acid ABC transporter permease [Lederbergia lenta]|uniref:Polar amino acid ABC transporter inner membrane subunit n=1 Tax=Lederbergia lenta TaxID=1467 RepID=A0A2X4W8X1_LEDLE|nr:amino acid ABC transporter permease [Lederbergia lenta]MCM3110356.1 amino acid ABC transporter permease [Lederbergia lenta]MEC2324076.1 amino acid ABC transporter permease [Lederbergia lenta]SQI60656.1 polar amino acid ABC transporter inner membrane subunit [Lederbergia lenta]